MASSDFLPDRELDLRQWSIAFSSRISESPEAYALTAEQAATYAALNAQFAEFVQLTNTKAGNSTANVVRKNVARKALVAEARKLARIIRASPAVTSAQRAALGLSVRDPGEEGDTARLPIPAAPPKLWIGPAEAHRVKIRVRDKEHRTKRGRPPGVLGVMIFTYIGALPPADAEAWRFHDQSTRTTMTLSFPGTVASGSTVWIKARWINPRLQPGPFCEPRYTNLPGGLYSSVRSTQTPPTKHAAAQPNQPDPVKLAA